jgi:NAD(P)-dependent dehydrogenase (short-subunit alcohol dehydrogenase family)
MRKFMSQKAKIKTVLITGSSGGVGSALVQKLSDRGWTVFAGVRSLDAAKRIGLGRKNVIPIMLDVCSTESVAAAYSEISKLSNREGLFAVINNAGISADGPMEIVSIEALRKQFEVNLFGAVAVTQAFLPLLRLSQGRIINMGGGAGRITLPLYGALSSSKAALDSITNAFRMELKHQGVNVVYVEPGGLQTQFFQKSAQASRDEGAVAPLEVRRIYGKATDAVKKAFAASKPEPVSIAVDAIISALDAKVPAPRYVIGKENKMHLMLLPKLSIRMRDKILMSAFGLKKEVFN